MDDNSPHFCMTCGAPLLESDTFCTKCGTKVGADAPATPQYTQNTIPTAHNSTLLIIGVLSLLWAIGTIILGAYMAASTDAIVSNLPSSTVDNLVSSGYNVSSFVSAIGAMLIISGVMGAITAILCFIRKFHIIAVAACIISAIFGLIVIVGFIGFIVAYLIHKSKHSFTGHGHTL